jgi:hypothetical protein
MGVCTIKFNGKVELHQHTTQVQHKSFSMGRMVTIADHFSVPNKSPPDDHRKHSILASDTSYNISKSSENKSYLDQLPRGLGRLRREAPPALHQNEHVSPPPEEIIKKNSKDDDKTLRDMNQERGASLDSNTGHGRRTEMEAGAGEGDLCGGGGGGRWLGSREAGEEGEARSEVPGRRHPDSLGSLFRGTLVPERVGARRRGEEAGGCRSRSRRSRRRK